MYLRGSRQQVIYSRPYIDRFAGRVGLSYLPVQFFFVVGWRVYAYDVFAHAVFAAEPTDRQPAQVTDTKLQDEQYAERDKEALVLAYMVVNDDDKERSQWDD